MTRGRPKGSTNKKTGAAALKVKKTKDANKPKRTPSAFFIFLEDFRTEYAEKHPSNKSVAAVTKAAGEKWRAMTDAEKAPYVAKQHARKSESEKKAADANKKPESSARGKKDEANDSDKSKSEVEDEEDEGEEEEDEE